MPLTLTRIERFREWYFLHYLAINYLVRTADFKTKFWVQRVERDGLEGLGFRPGASCCRQVRHGVR